jgi:hypothetical protein
MQHDTTPGAHRAADNKDTWHAAGDTGTPSGAAAPGRRSVRMRAAAVGGAPASSRVFSAQRGLCDDATDVYCCKSVVAALALHIISESTRPYVNFRKLSLLFASQWLQCHHTSNVERLHIAQHSRSPRGSTCVQAPRSFTDSVLGQIAISPPQSMTNPTKPLLAQQILHLRQVQHL